MLMVAAVPVPVPANPWKPHALFLDVYTSTVQAVFWKVYVMVVRGREWMSATGWCQWWWQGRR